MLEALHISDIPQMAIGTKFSEPASGIKGMVTLKLFDKDGNVISLTKSNQITFLGRHRLARIIGGDAGVSSTEKSLNTIKVSDGAVPMGGDALSPTAVGATDSGLFQGDTLKVKAFVLPAPSFSAVVNNLAPTVTFVTTLTSANVNMPINEAGVFFGSTGPMFAHYSFPTVDLRNTSNNSLEITWQFQF